LASRPSISSNSNWWSFEDLGYLDAIKELDKLRREGPPSRGNQFRYGAPLGPPLLGRLRLRHLAANLN